MKKQNAEMEAKLQQSSKTCKLSGMEIKFLYDMLELWVKKFVPHLLELEQEGSSTEMPEYTDTGDTLGLVKEAGEDYTTDKAAESRECDMTGKRAESAQYIPGTVPANRNYKDTVFSLLCRDKKNLLEMYNAMNGSNYTEVEELQIATLESAIYMGFKNDVAFLIGNYLNLYEHQSTWNPNMPLRNLLYIANEYQMLIEEKSLFSSSLQKIPTPKFVIFYNGKRKIEEKVLLKLSDAFEVSTTDPELELKVTALDINVGRNRELMEKCRILNEYSEYVACVRRYAEKLSLGEAVPKAIEECIHKGILSDFLRKQRAEVISVSIFEYDKEAEEAKLRKAEYEFGVEEGEKIGQELFAKLASKLIHDGRVDEVIKAAEDHEYRDNLYREYQL